MTAVSLTSTIGLRRTRGVLAFGLLVRLTEIGRATCRERV